MYLTLLPGLVCDRAIWAPVLPMLDGSAECRVADYAGLASISAMAAHVLADAPARFCLAGHSMGGRVALEIVRVAPGRVMRLALLDTGYHSRAPGAEGEAERVGRLELLELARRKGMRAMGLTWLEGMLHAPHLADASLTEAIAAMVARHSVATFAAQIDALLARPDATAVLRGIACPTLIGCGREDVWSPLSRHEDMARLVPGATLVPFDDCGHMAPMEQPGAVGAALLAWLTAPEAPVS